MNTKNQFYLGNIYDPQQGKVTGERLLYEPDDLTTHAVVVGMTGSGKTGLCISLLEEAALAGIPALMIDPKGDITNTLLHFPDLAPQDFLPWVDPDRARRMNAGGAENAARAAEGSGCRLVHLSTDFVFDGRARRPYLEGDPTGPLSEYGRSKLEGERRVAATCTDHLIVRTAWLYGCGRKNFVDAIRRRAREESVLEVVNDQFGSPTYVADVAEAIAALLPVEHRGIVHFANAGVCSRYDLAAAILGRLGPGAPRLRPITTGEAGRLAVRPAYSALDTALFSRITGRVPRPWEDALGDYLASGVAADGAAADA